MPQFALKCVAPAFPQFDAFAKAAGYCPPCHEAPECFRSPSPNGSEYCTHESEPMVKATGFREYDARWLFGKKST
jgi:hypothetical protein